MRWADLNIPPEAHIHHTYLDLNAMGKHTADDLRAAAERFERTTGTKATHVVWPNGISEKLP